MNGAITIRELLKRAASLWRLRISMGVLSIPSNLLGAGPARRAINKLGSSLKRRLIS
jgi:hypothetical protein